MKRVFRGALLSVVLFPALLKSSAQVPVTETITSKFPLTKASADRKDIVTAGSVLVLKKDGLLMFATDATVKASLTYKDGRIQPSFQTKMAAYKGFGHEASVVSRTFVAGEKFWLIDVQSVQDGVQLQLLSDPYSDVRYMASLKFPFGKGGSSSSQVIGEISQVMNVDSETPAQQANAEPARSPGPTPQGSPPPPQKFEAIAPPPAPVDQPVATIGIGSTREQVVAAWGQPQSVAKVSATKDIAVYATQKMKVTYTNNKVTNLQ